MDKNKPLLRILERMPIAVVIANPVTAKILWVNSRLVEMYGVEDPAQIIGSSLLDFIQPPQLSKALADLAKVAANMSPPPVTYQLKRANGEWAAGQVSSVPLLYGNQPAMLSFVADVSERERLVTDLQESEERYRTLLEELPSGVVVVVEDTVVWTNDSMARALGYKTAADIVGTSMYEHIEESQRKPIRQARREVMLSGQYHPPAPVTLLRRDGTQLHTTAATARVHWHGEFATQTLLYDIGYRDGAVTAASEMSRTDEVAETGDAVMAD